MGGFFYLFVLFSLFIYFHLSYIFVPGCSTVGDAATGAVETKTLQNNCKRISTRNSLRPINEEIL